MGKKHMATNADKMSAPDTKTGALGFALGMFAAMMGAQRPAMRLRKEQIPVPVPRTGAGKTSGVYACEIKH